MLDQNDKESWNVLYKITHRNIRQNDGMPNYQKANVG